MTRFLAWLFSLASIGAVFGLGGLAVLIWIYGSELPDHESLEQYQPPTISRVYDRDGRIMAEYLTERRVFAPVDEIPDLVKNAFIAAEDQHFYEHSGFDALGILSAVADYVQGGRLRGASTITQQVMKNFLLTNERSFERKFKEIILATRMEQVLSKDQILELYLNDIYLGARAYGVAAAAANYFGKPLEALTPAEAAYLAALPKAPSNLDPVDNREAALDRRAYVLGQMRRNDFITEAEYREALDAPLDTLLDGSIERTLPETPDRGYVSEEIRRQLVERLGEEEVMGGGLTIRATYDPELQAAAASALRGRLESWDRERRGWRGPEDALPEAALADEASWREALRGAEVPRDIPGWIPAVVLELGDSSARIGVEGVPDDSDGHYLFVRDAQWARPEREDRSLGPRPDRPADLFAVGDVILVSAEYEDGAEAHPPAAEAPGEVDEWELRQVPEIEGAFMAMDPVTGRVLAMQGGFSFQHSVFNRVTQARRQPGSSFKPFVYASALDNGYTPSTVIMDAPITIDTGADQLWRPSNSSNRFYGPAPMRVGIEQSRNVMTVRLARAIGMDVVAEYAERFGVYRDMPHHLSYALGAGETRLYDMVAAYGMFANGGWRVEPTLVDRVQDRRGETIYRHDARDCPDCRAPYDASARPPWPAPDQRLIMDPVTAYQLTSMMKGVVERGTATRLQSLGMPLAGKTGTTNDARDAWFIGFTPNMVAGCWIGYDNPRPMGRGAYGGTLCAPVFEAFMEVAMKDRPKLDFEIPPGAVMVKVDRASGRRLPDDASGAGVAVEAFRAGQAPEIGQYTGGEVVGAGFGMSADGGSDLPMTLPASTSASAAPQGGSGQGGASAGGGQGGGQGAGGGAGGGGGNGEPRPPEPGSGGFGSGGLY